MEHPQPAFEFLLSLPRKKALEDNILVDWYAIIRGDVEKGDDIRNHPEVWEVFELPEALAELNRDDHIAIQTFEGLLNLNALAIGLGLKNTKYLPEQFPCLIYEPDIANEVVLVWPSEVIVAIPKESGDASEAASGIKQLIDRIHKLGLAEDAEFDNTITTHRVSSVIS